MGSITIRTECVKSQRLTYTLTSSIIGHMEKKIDPLYTISELADAFGISTRTIRFYETKALLNPERVGGNRVYSYRDRARLSLVLRAKRLGFSLTDTRDYIELYEADPDHKEQLQLLLSKVRHRMQELQQQQEDLHTTLGELEDIQTLCLDHLIRIDESAQVD